VVRTKAVAEKGEREMKAVATVAMTEEVVATEEVAEEEETNM
jgi:hypothetical protein